MFKSEYDSNKKTFCLFVNIKCKTNTKKRFRVWAEEVGKKNSKYADRITHQDICVNGKVSIHLSFPVSPQKLFIGVLNADDPKDEAFEVVLIEAPLKTYNIDMSSGTEMFTKMAIKFSQLCGYEDADEDGRLFKTPNGEFKIKFFDVIRERLSGSEMGTPARVGHKTGIIEVAKQKFDKYTIPMRVIILLHEYAHVYLNPKIGLNIENEKGADINALYIYLGLGFSPIDAICVFANVFGFATSKSNMERMRLIYDYIKRFQAGEFAQLN